MRSFDPVDLTFNMQACASLHTAIIDYHQLSSAGCNPAIAAPRCAYAERMNKEVIYGMA
jgi:hypothetical protein